jgi:hypothetical protein
MALYIHKLPADLKTLNAGKRHVLVVWIRQMMPRWLRARPLEA